MVECLSVSDVCDIVHAIWVERIEADVRAAQQAAVLVSVVGGNPEWPSLEERLAEFEELLVAEPERHDVQDRELRSALGLRSPGG